MTATASPLRVAVLGTGVIGRDLVHKVRRSPWLRCELVAGRDPGSAGLREAARLGCPTTAAGIDGVLAAGPFDVVFDATSAAAHVGHWRLLKPLGTLMIDLTPSRAGAMVAPTVTGVRLPARNVNLISCGGQAAVPIAAALAGILPLNYLEAVSTVASDIAGRGTRINLDEYVATTAHALSTFSRVNDTKAILNISPAVPPATFRTTVHAVAAGGADPAAVRAAVDEAASAVRAFAPGYTVRDCTVRGEWITVSVEVTADSDVLPRHAGNLDIINSAAIMVAEQHAAHADRAVAVEAGR